MKTLSWLLLVVALGCGKKDSDSVAAKPSEPAPVAAPAAPPAADDPSALPPPADGHATVALVLANAAKAPSKWHGKQITLDGFTLASITTSTRVTNGVASEMEMVFYDAADKDQKSPLHCTADKNTKFETGAGVTGTVKVEAGVVSLEHCASTK